MADLVRRLVSGNRARFKDDELDLELDLTYITDNVIVMGYPASGVAGIYRNRREDAKKFLDHRHGANYWVFNFCPLRENSYDPGFFHERVSRYPFPDHHAPPLAILALASREIRLWLDGSSERVAVLHCKAGKGRSGTLACAYLLSLDIEPSAPCLERNYSKKELAKLKKLPAPSVAAQTGIQLSAADTAHSLAETAESKAKQELVKEHAEEIMNKMPTDKTHVPTVPETDTDEDSRDASANATSLSKSAGGILVSQPGQLDESQKGIETAEANGVEAHDFAVDASNPAPVVGVSEESQDASPKPISRTASPAPTKAINNLAAILDFHTSRRLRPSSSSSSSPSSSSSSSSDEDEESTFKLREAERPGPPPKQGHAQGVSISSQRRFLWYWSLVLANEAPEGFWPPFPYPPTSPNHDPGPPRSLVRVVDIKIRMRDTNSMATSAAKVASKLLGRFTDEKQKHDPTDLWVSTARYDDALVDLLERWERWSREVGPGGPGQRRPGGEHMSSSGSQDVQEIRDVFSDGRWDSKKMVRSFGRLVAEEGKELREGKAVTETLSSKSDTDGVTIDANREVRFKIYMGKIFMAWMWLIPTFHLPRLSASSAYDPVTLTLAKADLDFPIGLGASLIHVQLTLQRVRPSEGIPLPLPRASSGHDDESAAGVTLGPTDGTATFRERVNVRQGLED